MGRHIAFAASPVDEEMLLQFLRESTDIQIFASFAPSKEELEVDQFSAYGPNATKYSIWNKKYVWKPTYGRVSPEVKGNGGWYFIENHAQGPVLSLTRTDIDGFLDKDLAVHRFGGIWWGAYNRQVGFTKWFDSVVRWIRKHGQNLSPQSSGAVYCLPDALRLWKGKDHANE